MTQDAGFETITIAVEPYEDQTQTGSSVAHPRGWGGEAQSSKNMKQEKTLTVAELEQKLFSAILLSNSV